MWPLIKSIGEDISKTPTSIEEGDNTERGGMGRSRSFDGKTTKIFQELRANKVF